MGWDKDVTVHQIVNTSFSIEVEFETSDSGGKMWAIFVYLSNKEKQRKEQWGELLVGKVILR